MGSGVALPYSLFTPCSVSLLTIPCSLFRCRGIHVGSDGAGGRFPCRRVMTLPFASPPVWRFLVTASALITCACGTDDPRLRPQIDSSRAALDTTDWILVSLNGRPVIAGSNATARFDSASVGGYSGCNWYGSKYSARGDSITIDMIGGTARYCNVPTGAMDQEQQLYRTLERAKTFAITRDTLRFKTGDSTILEFRMRDHSVVNPQELIGSRWTLSSVNGKSSEIGRPVTLEFSTDSVKGFAGCRGYTGAYRSSGDEIRFPMIAMTSLECGAGREAQLREEQFTTDLSESWYYRPSGDTITLVTFPGRTLIFTRRTR
jgi:heat shock protein HslJ